MAETEEEVLRMRAKIFGAGLDLLKEVIDEQSITGADAATLTRPKAVKLVDDWLQEEQTKGTPATKAALIALAMNFEDKDPVKTEPTKTEDIKPEPAVKSESVVTKPFAFYKELKISGQIDCKSGISYMSLKRQIDCALAKKYSETDIIDAVIRAIPATSGLRRYLEGKPDLDLAAAKNILRAHYNEKSATELYNELGQATQTNKESPSEFLMRTLDLKQKVLFATKEEKECTYSEELVENLFRRTVHTGLQNVTVRQEFKAYLEDSAIKDENLIQNMNKIVSRETERQNKFGRVGKVGEVAEEGNTKGNREEYKTLRVELNELKELVRGKLVPDNAAPQRTNACRQCAQQGASKCGHCWKCGSSEHFKRGCKGGSGNGQKSHQGGGM